jgi:hypothetical protein
MHVPKEKIALPIILAAVAIFYLAQLVQPYAFRSPDEAANHVFITRFSNAQQLAFASPLTETEQQFYQPRSVVTTDGQIRPGSFLGFIMLHGSLTKWFGSWAIGGFQVGMFLLGLWCWYRIVRRYWEPVWALASVVLFATHPVVVQFVTLPLFHAGLFLSGLLITGLVLLRYQEQPTLQRAMWVGLAAGGALFIRPSEVFWVGPAIVVIMVARPNGWKHLVATGGIILAAQLPWMILSRAVFGSLLASGYTPSGIDAGTAATASGRSILSLLTPAGGMWNWAFLRHVWDFAIALFPVYSILTAISLGMYFRRKFFHWTKVLKIGLMVVFVGFILAYYGTWELYGGATPSAFGSWNSYDRYWLPLFTGTIAGVIVFFRGVLRVRFQTAAPLLAMMLLSNVVTVWFHPVAGLRARNIRSQTELSIRDRVVTVTPSNALIVAKGPDQFLYAVRSTSFYFPYSTASWEALRGIEQRMPIYFLIDARGKSVATWSAEAQQVGLRVEQVEKIDRYILAHVVHN